jgi:hypothetical protein
MSADVETAVSHVRRPHMSQWTGHRAEWKRLHLQGMTASMRCCRVWWQAL